MLHPLQRLTENLEAARRGRKSSTRLRELLTVPHLARDLGLEPRPEGRKEHLPW